MSELEKMSIYLDASEKMILKLEEDNEIESPLDYFNEEERKIFDLYEKEFEDKYPFIANKIGHYFFDYSHGETPKKFDSMYEYRNNVLEHIDYFKFKHKIKTNYKYKNSPF